MRTECDGEWDNPDTGYLWGSWVKRAINGKPGQKFLRELLAALLALPEKELILDNMAKGGGVCALGAVALKRKLDAGVHRNQAEADLANEYWSMESGYGAHEIAVNNSKKMKITKMLAFEIMDQNDRHCERMSPALRYQEVLGWVRRQIVT